MTILTPYILGGRNINLESRAAISSNVIQLDVVNNYVKLPSGSNIGYTASRIKPWFFQEQLET